jgi:hypothetical protein
MHLTFADKSGNVLLTKGKLFNKKNILIYII